LELLRTVATDKNKYPIKNMTANTTKPKIITFNAEATCDAPGF